ncbi:hypothetical protein HETIRDRAFT_120544 [Heterobasidion irregulare TC 32-1]|uniref:Retrotransposon gag domain-containing protein n=1 Tax=Heterobasidion irregulare (strain TC 32-1) TaxID=747525 RepID=W4JPS6_HETIT|nr:uncharacterized protein HETIRDRAFT_120544 [Heterobasidion irregulare TC 32-1]ETW74876.1 hypothetical protein HETIRDRAFT_120544 [Heterobasidion irregulare TC 32-1]
MAGAWAENLLAKIVGTETPKDLGAWSDLLAKFRLQFKESNKMDKACNTLMAFSQGRMTMDEYSNQFLLIAANADISEKEQVPYYQQGLDPQVMDKIYNKETLPKDTIQDWINIACKVDGHMRACSAQKAILANSTSFRKSGMPTAKSIPMMASHLALVITVEKQGIRILTVFLDIKAFNHLEEAQADLWERQGEEIVQLIWKMKMTQDLLWETKRDYIEEWQRGVLIAMTSSI